MFSSALRALTTPVCRSARTFVVPPGVSEMRRFGDAGGCSPGSVEEEAAERSAGSSLAGVWRDVAMGPPSSARARALPVGVHG